MVASDNPPINNSIISVAYVRDKDYYFEDGSIIVLAEDYLFKIHKTLFERDSPFFQSLMSLPQGGNEETTEGQSDENPVFCPDSAGDFRALCWVVYSRPADVLAQQILNTVDVPRLICVAAIAYKYDFTAFEEWAWNALHDSYTAQPLNFFHKCGTWSAVARIFKLAVGCGKTSLVNQLEGTWLDQISTSSTRATAFKQALDVMEGSDLFREFHAKCYYVYLQSSGAFAAQAQDNSILPVDLDEAGSQMGNSLPDLRVRLSQPPKLAENPSCQKHATDCIPGWNSWWKDIISNAVQIGDPGLLIEHILEKAKNNVGAQRQPSPYGFTDTIAPIPCQAVVRSSMGTLKRDFYTSLASRFMLS